MADSNLTFAKIVANPSVYSWSQAYNAGKLFAVLSLETQEDLKEKDYLNVLGKEILDNLEQEFFTLEKKDLESIKQAVETTSTKIPSDVSCSFVISTFVGNVLYVYILGDGKVSLKREGKVGNLLESLDQTSTSLKVASGFLQAGDTLILQTKQFARAISSETLMEHLDDLKPEEAAENLAPLVHEKEESGASAIIINYTSIEEEFEKPQEIITEAEEEKEVIIESKEKDEPIEEESQSVEEEKSVEEPSPFYASEFSKENNKTSFNKYFLALTSKIKLPGLSKLNHPRKVILTVVLIIIVVFAVSVFFALKNQQDAKTKAVFSQIYPAAEKKYEEGQGLMELNQNLARDSFTQAKKLLDEGKDKLPKDSSEEKQVLSLLGKVNSALSQTSGVNNVSAKEVDLSKSPLLSVEAKNSAISFAQDDKNVYMLTSSGVYSFSLDGADKKQIIKNDSLWENGAGIFPYSGNLYVLDKKGQIIKFVQTDSGYSDTNYFSNTNPDFSKAISIAIDNNIYVLKSDGTISKFFKGASVDFSLTGLDQELSSPTAIYTTPDFDNIYVLDKGNSRVVVFDKSGNYKGEYNATQIKNAKDFVVSEKDKLIYVLSQGKLYQIDLK